MEINSSTMDNMIMGCFYYSLSECVVILITTFRNVYFRQCNIDSFSSSTISTIASKLDIEVVLVMVDMEVSEEANITRGI